MMSLCKLRSEIELLCRKILYVSHEEIYSVQFDSVRKPGASVCTSCCLLLGVVVQSLKLVKFLATWKRIQQLPTMVRPFAPGYSL